VIGVAGDWAGGRAEAGENNVNDVGKSRLVAGSGTCFLICTFLPDSCGKLFHSCIPMPSSSTTSPTENTCGCKSGSKKKDPRIVLSALDGHENSAEM